MDDWKYEIRRKRRGRHCLIYGVTDKIIWGGLCGCGIRTPPPKKKKTRIVKRALAKGLVSQIRDLNC